MTQAPRHLPREGKYQWIYLWSLPLRTMHWLSAMALVVLGVTGIYIGNPFIFTGGDTADHFLMGRVRFAHFLAAGVLVMTAIVRLYWLFAGNRYERWEALFPVRRDDLRHFWLQFKSYLTVRYEDAPQYLGHNPMQQMSYTGLYLVAAVQVATGFALYGQSNPGGFFFTVFGWLGPLFGGMPNLRFVHHVLTWVFACYIPIHIYFSIRADMLEHSSMISSMITGGRFEPVDKRFEDG
jgi:Ni/Fe-hydrogenase b-type cytochrome subunit